MINNATKIKITVIFILVALTACNEVKIYPGRVEIVDRSFDQTLQDSAMIHGYVLDASEEKPLWNLSVILITETGDTTLCDSIGYYFIKLLPGIYTVECFYLLPTQNDSLKLENLKILPNEKVQVNFFKEVEVS